MSLKCLWYKFDGSWCVDLLCPVTEPLKSLPPVTDDPLPYDDDPRTTPTPVFGVSVPSPPQEVDASSTTLSCFSVSLLFVETWTGHAGPQRPRPRTTTRVPGPCSLFVEGDPQENTTQTLLHLRNKEVFVVILLVYITCRLIRYKS